MLKGLARSASRLNTSRLSLLPIFDLAVPEASAIASPGRWPSISRGERFALLDGLSAVCYYFVVFAHDRLGYL